jgi:hypothetical protein
MVTYQSLSGQRLALSLLLWALPVAVAIVVAFAILVPYYGSGGCYPSTPPNTFPDRQDEHACIARFTGTLWQQPFFHDAFWHVNDAVSCLWIPALALVSAETRFSWPVLSSSGKGTRLIGLAVIFLVFGSWLYAELATILWEQLD